MSEIERLKSQVEILKKENAKLKSKFRFLRTRCKPGAEKYFDIGMYGMIHIDTLKRRTSHEQ